MQLAVIAFDGRFPGDAETPESFWEALVSGRELIETVPPDRWSSGQFHWPGATRGLAHSSPRGGFLRHVDQFDPQAFGISPREADTMDPAQRLLLEVTWRCWEQAGLRPSDWAGHPVGVFVGAFTPDYLMLQLGSKTGSVSTLHSATGTAQTLLSNRISYCYGLAGPSLTVDTACSSSLVALHLAATSLARGESKLAFAAGVQLQLTPYHTAFESRGGFLSPEGRVRAFDHRANGYVRGEAVAAVLLAPLDRALRENWPVHLVIHATGVNQNGRSDDTAGIAHPNPSAQEQLLRDTLCNSGIGADEIGYVEAHGTGTRAGDAAELTSIGRAIGARHLQDPLLIGSVKTNTGHTEAASGLVGLIKVILAMGSGIIPPHLHWEKAPENVDMQALGLRLPLSLEAWPEKAPYALVNSFGFGGTNATAVVGPSPVRPEARAAIAAVPARVGPDVVLLLSAPSNEHLALQASSLGNFLEQQTDSVEISQVSAALAYQRERFSHRAVFVGCDRRQLSATLVDYARRIHSSEWIQGAVNPQEAYEVVWVCAGMGPQWSSMGRELARAFLPFAEAVERCDQLFARLAGYSLLQRCWSSDVPDQPLGAELAQPLNFFLQTGLAALLQEHGVRPAAVVGHSVGEIAAFHLAGGLSLETAIHLVYHRSRLQGRLAGAGAMAAVGASAGELQPLLEYHGVCIAARNSPNSVTVAGGRTEMDSLVAELEQAGRYVRRLSVDVPYHSNWMDGLEAEFRQAIGDLVFEDATLPLYSTVTGQRMKDLSHIDFADYWWQNMRHPVAFAETLAAMPWSDASVIQELSAQPVLHAYLRELTSSASVPVLPTLKRALNERTAFIECLAHLHVHGVPVTWKTLIPQPTHSVSLPGFVWHRQRHWSESEQMRSLRLAQFEHPLLGCRMTGLPAAWQTAWSAEQTRSLADHNVLGQPRLPAAAFLEIFHAAARILTGNNAVLLTDVKLDRGVLLPDTESPVLTTVVHADRGTATIYDGQSTPLAQARFATTLKPSHAAAMPGEDEITGTIMEGEAFYLAARRLSFHYGPSFQRIRRIRFGRSRAWAVIDGTVEPGLYLPSAVLDAGLQMMLVFDPAWPAVQTTGRTVHSLPAGVDEVRFLRPLTEADFPVTATCALRENDSSTRVADVNLYSSSGELLALLQGVRFQSIATPSALSGGHRPIDHLFHLSWSPLALTQPALHLQQVEWLILCGEGKAGEEFLQLLRRTGYQAHLLSAGEDADPGWSLLQSPCEHGSRIVVDLQALEWTSGDGSAEQDCDRLQEAVRRCIRLAERAHDDGVSIWTVTRGACDEVAPHPAQAALWGLVRGLMRAEHSDLWNGLADLPAELPADWPLLLHTLIASAPRQQEFRWAGAWQHSRLQACVAPAVETPLWLRPNASYLITGAFGALGRVTAEYLVSRGARHLVLLGRAPLPDTSTAQTSEVSERWCDRQQWMASLRERGVQVLASGFDLRHEEGWNRVLQQCGVQGLPPLRGVVHAAGISGQHPMLFSSSADVAEILETKVLGVDHLLHKIPAQQLDFLLFYSSVAGLFPAFGQTVYAAANNYLDALARRLQSQHIAARSIAWGPWSVGMAGDESLLRVFRKQGFLPIAAHEGMSMLAAALAQPYARIYCAALDAEQFLASNRRHLWQFDNLWGDRTRLATRVQPHSQQLDGLSQEQLRSAALSDLRQDAAGILRLPVDELNEATVLSLIGMDSLMAVELQIALAMRWAAAPEIHAILGRFTLATLANQLAERQSQSAPRMANDFVEPVHALLS